MKLYFYLREPEAFHHDIDEVRNSWITGLSLSRLPPTEDHTLSNKYPCIGHCEVEFEYDDELIKNEILASLEREETEIRAKFQQEIERIQNKKDQLLAIEHVK